jgi:hypothetical protein
MKVGRMEPHYCRFHFQSNVNVLAPVRRFVSDIVERLINKPEVASRIEVAVHELAENSLKYASLNGARIEIEVHDVPKHMRVVVRTTNHATPEFVKIVCGLIDEMNAAADPVSYYLKIIDRTAGNPLVSGLGLARVFAESGMRLSYSRPSSEEVAVTAEFVVPATNAPTSPAST